MRMNRKAALAVGAGMAAMLLAACSDSPMAPSGRVAPKPSFAVGDVTAPTPDPVVGKIIICKLGNTGGTFQLSNQRIENDLPVGAPVVTNVTVDVNTCKTVVEDFSPDKFGSRVTITEQAAPNTAQALTACSFRAVDNTTTPVACSLDPASARFTNNFHGYVITYTNTVEEPPPPGCTYTQGFWKTHGPAATGNNTNEWPVDNLNLGNVNYTDAQLQTILNTAVKGNGLIALAHQLIAAKLNIANGADDTDIAATITAADALIGNLVVGTDSLSTSAVASLVNALAAFNEGVTGPGHCDDEVLVS